jgi:hypothetical protein
MKRASLLAPVAVAIGFLVLVCFGLMQNRTDKAIIENSVRHGLIQCYLEAAHGRSGFITPEQMKNVIQSNLYAPSSDIIHLLPSFVKSEDVYYSMSPVAIDSSNIICAIRFRESAYMALKGDGDCMVVTKNSVHEWPHTN